MPATNYKILLYTKWNKGNAGKPGEPKLANRRNQTNPVSEIQTYRPKSRYWYSPYGPPVFNALPVCNNAANRSM